MQRDNLKNFNRDGEISDKVDTDEEEEEDNGEEIKYDDADDNDLLLVKMTTWKKLLVIPVMKMSEQKMKQNGRQNTLSRTRARRIATTYQSRQLFWRLRLTIAQSEVHCPR